MRVKTIVNERFQDYRKPSLFIATSQCDWKCCIEAKRKPSLCQNSPIARMNTVDVAEDEIFLRYISDPITQAIVIGGLEPMLQQEEVLSLIHYFRSHQCHDEFVIFTGYEKHEVKDFVRRVAQYDNIIMKFGRFIPDAEKRFDPVLGIYLISSNQYAEKIS